MNKLKKKILIVFGGKSGEHEVSVRSAQSIEKYIDQEKFETQVIGITHQGVWNHGTMISEITKDLKVLDTKSRVMLPQSDQEKKLSLRDDEKNLTTPLEADIIFPILHGTNGEDGTLQGMLELANIPYVGSGVLGSSVCMDKVIQKQICQSTGIPQTKYLSFLYPEYQENPEKIRKEISDKLAFPIFVKPANMGSSVGISKVKTAEELDSKLKEAFAFDNKVIVEESIENILEIEVSVLGNDHPQASVCASIQPNTEFYDYETKYITDDIDAQIPAQIPTEISEKIRQLAVKTFQVLNCWGMARVDFFYQLDTGKVFLNEINTLPGFTNISMYPKMWEKSGLNYTDLITKLLELAEEKWESKQRLSYQY